MTTNKVYEKYRLKEIKNEHYDGFVVGYTEDRFIVSTTTHPVASFRRLDKDTYIEEDYKDPCFRFLYCDEKTLDKYFDK